MVAGEAGKGESGAVISWYVREKKKRAASRALVTLHS
jgi:hypothetical protein